jgi:hypothetical protein
MDTKMMLLGALGLLGVVALRGKSEAAPATTYGGEDPLADWIPPEDLDVVEAAPTVPNSIVRMTQEYLNRFRTRLLAAQQLHLGGTEEPFNPPSLSNCGSSGALDEDGIMGPCTDYAASVASEILAEGLGMDAGDLPRLLGFEVEDGEWSTLARTSIEVLTGVPFSLWMPSGSTGKV